MTLPQVFDVALQRHREGWLAEAEALYRQILAAQPSHAGALHLLGLVHYQTGRHERAVDLICQAIALNPNYPAAHCNLGEAWRATGRFEEAIAAYGRALQLNPDYPEAHNNLGIALRERGRLNEAVAAYRRALELIPDYPEAHNNLGIALKDLGRLDEAVAAYQQALGIKPDFPEAHNNLGNALRERGQFVEAVAACRRALQLKPDLAEAHNNLGNALRGQGQLDEAAAAFHRALELKPNFPEAHNNLGATLTGQNQLDTAIAAYRRALQLRPDYAEAINNLGAAMAARWLLDEAIAAFHRALELKSDFPKAYDNLGSALKDKGELDEALAAFRHALRLRPEDAGIHGSLIYTLHFHPGFDAAQIAEEQRDWNHRLSQPLRALRRPHANNRDPKRRLRVGYVSPDFRNHVVGRNLLPMFERHDPRDFEIFCYSGAVCSDQVTDQIRPCVQHWRSTVGVGDEALADMIRGDGVDILVDLTQHMAGNRLPVFARKPAPVQASFAGYPESTGLETIEHRISDRYLEGFEPERKEQVHLIDSFWCYDPRGRDVEVNPLPALKSETVTFGCLNNFCKVNERALSLWARALGNVKDSRLVIASPAGDHRRRTLDILEREGVARRRVEFVEPQPQREYLELYHRLDIVLDTSPYNGHTTNLDALWMGVPVVSLAGNTPVSRAGLSQLTNLGLPELAAHSESEYMSIAGSLARDLPRLADLRSTLRGRMKASVLMDAPRFTRQVEQAYRKMWEAWGSFNGLKLSLARPTRGSGRL